MVGWAVPQSPSRLLAAKHYSELYAGQNHAKIGMDLSISRSLVIKGEKVLDDVMPWPVGQKESMREQNELQVLWI